MLQRTLQRSLRSGPLNLVSSAASTCHVCRCRCGVIVSTKPQTTTARSYATKRNRIAPTVRKRNNERLSTADEKRWQIEVSKARRKSFLLGYRNNPDTIKSPQLELHVDEDEPSDQDILAFYDAVMRMCEGATETSLKPQKLLNLLEKHNMVMSRVYYGAQQCVSNATDKEDFAIAERLMMLLSRAGSPEATILITWNAEMKHRKTGRSALKQREYIQSRAHLTKLADEGSDCRAMVLEGRIALTLGNEERAIALWTRAVDQALKDAAATSSDPKNKPNQMQLDSPWIELMLLHHARCQRGKNEWDEAIKYMEIGCEQDDPISHYWAAEFKKRYDADGVTHLPTSDWLYHMTKAATSDHNKAQHELAIFYADSIWKYIDDEPPDNLKPTPFDSYPGDEKPKSWWERIREFIGLEPIVQTSERDNIWHSAAFPSTAADRTLMAIKWLNIAESYMYAPSYLFHAQILMKKTLWGDATAPESALELSSSRYTFASKEDYDNNNPIPKPEQPQPPDIPNPYYDLEAAKLCIREIFFAHQAHQLLTGQQMDYERRLRAKQVAEIDIMEDFKAQDWKDEQPIWTRKWWNYPDVQDMYENEIEDLYLQAKAICDERGWDMVDERGGLVYRAVVRIEADT